MTPASDTTERRDEATARISMIDHQINLIENSFGGSAYVDGLLRQRLEDLQAERAALVNGSPAPTPAGEAEKLIETVMEGLRKAADCAILQEIRPFMEAALRRTQPPQQTGDGHSIVLPWPEYLKLIEAIESPTPNPELAKLLRSKAPWETKHDQAHPTPDVKGLSERVRRTATMGGIYFHQDILDLLAIIDRQSAALRAQRPQPTGEQSSFTKCPEVRSNHRGEGQISGLASPDNAERKPTPDVEGLSERLRKALSPHLVGMTESDPRRKAIEADLAIIDRLTGGKA